MLRGFSAFYDIQGLESFVIRSYDMKLQDPLTQNCGPLVSFMARKIVEGSLIDKPDGYNLRKMLLFNALKHVNA